jgi:hypothetical protein
LLPFLVVEYGIGITKDVDIVSVLVIRDAESIPGA